MCFSGYTKLERWADTPKHLCLFWTLLLFVVCVVPLGVVAQPADGVLTEYEGDIELDQVFETEIYQVVLNSDTLAMDSIWALPKSTILITTRDTLSIYYALELVESVEVPENTNFLYKVVLANQLGDISKNSLNVSSLTYYNLQQEEYTFEVSAFDIKREWATTPTILRVNVDNGEVLLADSIRSLNRMLSDEGSALAGENWLGNKSTIIYFVAGVIFTVLLMGLLYIFMASKKNDKLKKKLKKNEIYESEPYQALQNEKNRLQMELDALRLQISGMEFRSEQIRVKNRELEQKVSRLTESKDDLEQLQEQKDDLFAVIIHDIKNPVGIIKNLVELLRSFDLTATEQQEIMEDIVKTTQTIVSLSHEVSRVLALEGGRMAMNYSVQDVSPLVTEIADRNRAKAKKKNISLEFTPGIIEPFSYDAMKIYEVVDNLISNAVKFTQEGGSVRVRTYQQDNNAVIEIADNGLGLSEDDLQKAFKKGSQLSARPTAGESSTGLGLWIVKKLVEAHEGKVSVKSKLGQGSTFSVFLTQSPENQSKVVEM